MRTIVKILLAAINAKYIHSNLAVYSLKGYCSEFQDNIVIKEFTINNYSDEILKSIYKEKPDVVAFSCYIWNISMVDETACELKKILPNTDIWAGGPEVSYNPLEQLKEKPWLTGIMIGEGEETFYELVKYYTNKSGESLEQMKGIAYRTGGGIVKNHLRPPLDLSSLPFPYGDMKDFENKIIYYETSRGCPFSCSYCLSSIEKGIRLRDIELVKKELKFFIDHKVPLVKFIDRTFNCNHDHAMAVWEYIYEQDRGTTNFHFEISADLLRADEIELVNRFRPGLVQFEIGVQSVNPRTIHSINRKMNLEKLKKAVESIKRPGNVHQHLDLIAGLPYEDFASFQESFNYVYRMKPDQLQLGFLKVLKGSEMSRESTEFGIQYKDKPPFEVLCTRWLTYDQILELKKIEEMVEIYYNSGQFVNSIGYLEHFFESPYELYKAVGGFYEENRLDERNHSRISRYSILLDFVKERLKEEETVFSQLLLFDLYLRENLKTRPDFAGNQSLCKELFIKFYQNRHNIDTFLPDYKDYNAKQIMRMTHLEFFDFDLLRTVKAGIKQEGRIFALFDYKNRNPLNHQAACHILHEL